MTLQEILKAQGITEEQIEAVTGEMKKQKIFTAGEENLDIRYSKLKTDHENLQAQHGESTKLIEQFKADAKNNESLTAKISAYESQIGTLQEQLRQTQIESEAKVALLTAECTDVGYAIYKLKEKGPLELDDQGHIKGMDEKLADLKITIPAQFKTSETQKKMEVQKLPRRNERSDENDVSKEEFNKMGYASRVELKQNDPELYSRLMKG